MHPSGELRAVGVLFVCTGNVCRSPFAAALLGERLAALRPGRFEVGSAGTHALVGADLDPGCRHELASRGVRPQAFRARQVSADLLGRADLVVAMTAAQRSLLIEMVPPVRPQVVLLGQLEHSLRRMRGRRDAFRLAQEAGADDTRMRWRLLPQVVDRHGRLPSLRRVRDVPDPYRRGQRAFARMARTVEGAVDELLWWEARFPQ